MDLFERLISPLTLAQLEEVQHEERYSEDYYGEESHKC